jgi:hypothetical protein
VNVLNVSEHAASGDGQRSPLLASVAAGLINSLFLFFNEPAQLTSSLGHQPIALTNLHN